MKGGMKVKKMCHISLKITAFMEIIVAVFHRN